MMLKVFGLIVVVAVVMMVVGGPNALAQQTEKWHTYYKPLEFSIDYPDFKGILTNVTELETYGHPTIYIEGPVVSMIISKSIESWLDPQEIAVIYKQSLLESSNETEIAQDIFTSIYDGEIGYTFVTYNPNQQVLSSETLIRHGQYVYDISLGGMSNDSNMIYNFNHVLNSIKFF